MRAYDHCTAAYLNQAGVPNTLIRLADVGVRGNGHMMMIEKNNAAIAGVIAQWLDRQRLRAAAGSTLTAATAPDRRRGGLIDRLVSPRPQ